MRRRWAGAGSGAAGAGGLSTFCHYRRSDGLFRTPCAADGTALDERAFLYDQAFVSLAARREPEGSRPRARLIAEAEGLPAVIRRLPAGGA
jgi:mannose/cellobiose epimerase-like protein (N-acyl-D-glucosamine 2-epimerase family)